MLLKCSNMILYAHDSGNGKESRDHDEDDDGCEGNSNN